MPLISPSAKVLVTGASGFIAAWVCNTLLDEGYHVVGTVRSRVKGEFLVGTFKKKGYGEDKFSYVIVEDMEKDGAFDDAVVGMDAVEHTASPVHIAADDPNDIIKPAVNGTVGILRSIKSHAPNVKRVVITSSLATIVDQGSNRSYDETHWNTLSPSEVDRKGKDASGVHKYRASKVLAERAAWDFVERHKGEIGFDLVTVHPGMTWGPIIHQISSPDALNTSIKAFWSQTKPGSQPDFMGSAGSWGDVRDVAMVHVKALCTAEAGGERFIACTGYYTFQDVLDILHKQKPGRTDVPLGTPGVPTPGRPDVVGVIFSSSKAHRVLGIRWRSLEETAPETLESLRAHGF